MSSLRFTRGQNPYDSKDFIAYWHAAGAPPNAAVDESGRRPIYPPSTFFILSPFCMLDWLSALVYFEILSVGLVLWVLIYLARKLDSRSTQLLFVAYALILAPLSTGLSVANVSIPAVTLCLLAVLLAADGRELLAGAMLAISICLKPTTGLPGLVYLLFVRRWRVCGYALALSTMITGAALMRMHYLPARWQVDYRANLNYLFGPTGAASYSSASDGRFDLLNLQVPVFALTQSHPAAEIIPWVLVLILGGWWLAMIRTYPALAPRLESAAVVLLLGLLPVYQRSYNAGFVLLALLWAFMNLEDRVAKAILIVGFVFVIPGEALIRTALHGHSFSSGRLWNGVVMPQESWALVALVVIQLGAIWRTSRQGCVSRSVKGRDTGSRHEALRT
ncbi:MAG: DUF2029 domain-containing protein [Silvibacterium sp.]|nr:DUF2029 domain-containing protein [Silvibacterium sp.]